MSDVVNACTELNTPDRVRNVPNNVNKNDAITSTSVHVLNAPRRWVTRAECSAAVAVSQGWNEAFSTGSHAQ